MWEVFKDAQNMNDIVEKYKDLVSQYRTFGYDLLNIKDDLEFYLSALPAIFLAGAFVHLYYFRKAQKKISYLEGTVQSKDKQIEFLRDLLEKKIGTKQQEQKSNATKTPEEQQEQKIENLLQLKEQKHVVDEIFQEQKLTQHYG